MKHDRKKALKDRVSCELNHDAHSYQITEKMPHLSKNYEYLTIINCEQDEEGLQKMSFFNLAWCKKVHQMLD